MHPIRFRDQSLFAPFFIFIRGTGWTDRQLLSYFGLVDYHRNVSPTLSQHCIFLMEDDTWTHIADDWHYTLWHSPAVHTAISRLTRTHDVFTCLVGDVDQSFAFSYAANGSQVRTYKIESPDYQSLITVINEGTPLPGEESALALSDPLAKVMALARSLGIDTVHQPENIRIYSPVTEDC